MTIKVIHVRVQIIIKGHSKRKRGENKYIQDRQAINLDCQSAPGRTVIAMSSYLYSNPQSRARSLLIPLPSLNVTLRLLFCVQTPIFVFAVYFMLSFLKHIALPLLSRVSYSFAKFRHSNGISCICISIRHVERFKRWIY